MNARGRPERPLRVAVVGAGPAGFYVVQQLLQAAGLAVRIDMFERLPAPFGLVRYGVAPDHPKIKSVTTVYERLAGHAAFRLYGNVEFGRDLSLDDLLAHYDQIVFCTGAQADRRLGIAGEDLAGSHSATEFVGWYNAHPDYARREFDLSCRRAVVVGVGNVAIDVARILCRTAEELERTDIADHALAALRGSHIEEVQLIGRRGPAQAAFSNLELEELEQLQGAAALAPAEELELDPASRRALDSGEDRLLRRRMEILGRAATRTRSAKPRSLVIRFLLSPTALEGDAQGRVRAIRLVRNELARDAVGGAVARPTGRTELVETGLVLRAVGYRSTPLPGLPFRDQQGVVPSERGRIVDPATGRPRPGLYVSGWIKRGPTGLIGTNKPDAAETVGSMLEDLARGTLLDPSDPEVGAVEPRLRQRGVRFVSYEDWRRIDAEEQARGQESGRPRVKLADRGALLELLRY